MLNNSEKILKLLKSYLPVLKSMVELCPKKTQQSIHCVCRASSWSVSLNKLEAYIKRYLVRAPRHFSLQIGLYGKMYGLNHLPVN